MLKDKNKKMLDLAFEKGISDPEFRNFINQFPKDFLLFLNEGVKSQDMGFKLKAIKVTTAMLEALDDQVDEIVAKTGSEKGLVYYVLFHEMGGVREFDEAKKFCKQKGLLYGDAAMQYIMDNYSEPPKKRSTAKKPQKGKKA